MATPPKQPGFSISRRIAAAKTKEFSILDKFALGYRNREDKTALPPGVLIEGSQNVLTSVSGRISSTTGYTLDGQSSAVLAPILSAYDWEMSQGFIRHLRAGFLVSADGKMQYRYVHADGSIEWRDLLGSLTSVLFNFTNWWSAAILPDASLGYSQSLLLFVNGLSQIFEWSGGITTLLSTTDTAGAVATIYTGQSPAFHLPESFGGKNYQVGDILTLTAGNNDATVTVSSVRNAAIYSVASVPTNGGFNYVVGEELLITQPSGAIQGIVIVDTVDGSGTVLTLHLLSQGTGYATGTKSTLTQSGIGTGCTVNITEVDDGAITVVTLTNGGTGYSAASGISVTGGHGTGALMEILSISNNAITKEGATTWAQEGFYSHGTHEVVINGVTYTATGGWDSLTLTGVSPDPTGAGVAGDVIHQAVEITLNSDMTVIPPNFENDLIITFDQQLYVGSLVANSIYASHIDDYKNFGGFNNPRMTGDGITLIANAPPKAFIIQEDLLYISAGVNQWYTVSQDNVNFITDEIGADIQQFVTVNVVTPTLHRLKTSGLQGAMSQAFVGKNKNDVIFVSFEPIVNSLGRVDNILVTPQISDLSFSIVNDMNNYDFTDGSIFFWQNFILFSAPKEGITRLYNMTKDTTTQNPTNSPIHYWEAPLTLPFSRFSIIDGELYGHSYLVSESYKLFEGFNFNGSPIVAKAMFSYQQDGVVSTSKSFNEFYVEGYIAPNTTITLTLFYELDGFAGEPMFEINGEDSAIVQSLPDDNSLGKNALGKVPLGGDIGQQSSLPPKFRVIKTFPRTPYYEFSPQFSSIGKDYQWSILRFGPAASPTSEGNNPITE